jgi:hypothetical protein
LWSYPAQTAFGRVLPKNKIYEHSGANTRLKDLFVKQVEQIVWQHKLAPETMNLQARPDVPEIQVFGVQLKAAELHEDVLHCIDAAVQFPIVFELKHGKRIRVVAAHKRPSEADRGRWVVSGYYATAWLPANTPRTPMPVALHLGGLYEQLLRALIPLAGRAQETLEELVARAELAKAKQREVEKTAVRLAKERQFNRRVEINAALRQLQTELKALSS